MRLHMNHHVEVTRLAAVRARTAHAGKADTLAVINTGRNVHLESLRLSLVTGAAAVRARILDHLTGAVAVRAGLLNREEALRHTDRTAAAAVRAGRLGGAGLAAGTVTGFAGIPDRNPDLGLHALRRILERNRELILEILARVRVGTRIRAAATRLVAEHVAEDISEHASENIGSVHSAHAAHIRAAGGAIQTFFSESVIGRALLRVGQRRIGSPDLFKLFLCGLIPRIPIRVVLHSETPIRLLDFFSRSIARNTQDLVIISISHLILPSAVERNTANSAAS